MDHETLEEDRRQSWMADLGIIFSVALAVAIPYVLMKGRNGTAPYDVGYIFGTAIGLSIFGAVALSITRKSPNRLRWSIITVLTLTVFALIGSSVQ